MNSFDKVYSVVARIPKGKVTTYKEVAELSGISPRYVGRILHQNPDPEKIPCHRVVNIKGELAIGYAFGGAGAQRKKLESERVRLINGRVDLAKYIHKFSKP